ncbi:MAG: hypothetical protein HYR85_10860 [Planctomycetes bacterium]|nr:hypothetical protein [Planctomycetota bacterium]MBI3847285.1 hypothetical protein [Planctomycetota bacterium]
MTSGETAPISAARIGFFVGGIVGLVLIVPGLDGPGCVWVPGGAVFTIFLSSRRGPVELRDGLKGGAVCGLVAALVFVLNTSLVVARDPVAFARNTRLEVGRWFDPDPGSQSSELVKAWDDAFREKEKLAAERPRAAILDWIGLFILGGIFMTAISVIGGLFGVYLFRGRAPPDDADSPG